MFAEHHLLRNTVLLLSLGACTPAEPIELSFAWPPGESAVVEETVALAANQLTLRYRLRLEPLAEGGFVLTRDQLEVLPMAAGSPIEPDQLEDWVIPLRLQRPPLHIGADGRALGLYQPQAFAAELSSGLDPEADAEMLQSIELAAHEATRPTMEARATQAWNAWVTSWLGCRLAPGARERCETDLAMPWGTSQAPVDRGSGGYVDQPEGHVRLLISGSFAADQLGNAALLRMLGGPNSAAATVSLQREVLLDPTTMRPAAANWQLQIASPGQDPVVSSHDYRFDWSGRP